MKFAELDLHPLLQKNLDRIQFVECTPIQAEAMPNVLKGRDIAGLAQTGTGKTAAFLVPLIDRVLKGRDMIGQGKAADETVAADAPPASQDVSLTEASAPIPAEPAILGVVETEGPETQNPEELHLRYFPDWRRRQYILILVPTRELAEQVYENAQTLLEGTGLKAVSVMGGTTYDKQKAGFKDGVEFVIATPGRLIDLYKEHIADLRQVRAVVFDEADRMFDMGFKDDMKFILKRIPRERQFLVFSATLNFDVLNVAYEFGAFPVEVNISKDQPKAENVEDEILHVGQADKPKFLLSLLKKHNPRQAIIFSNFKRNVERITKFLNDNGVPAVGISSLLTQAQRNRVMAQFKADNDRNILVATDLAARGLDILGVDVVMNFELPEDPENYVHRIGRTGRAGLKGRAVSLVSDRDVDSLSRIENYLDHKVAVAWVEDSEIVQEMRPFPADFERHRPRDRGGERGGERGRFRERRPDRRDFSRGGQRPRPERGQGPDRGHGSDRGQGPARPEREAGGRPENRHRGRRGGPRRHRDQQTQGPSSSQHPRSNPNQAQGQGQGRPQRPAHSRPQRARRPDGGHHPSQPNRQQGPRPAARVASPPSLGQKVSGFFKKIFGQS